MTLIWYRLETLLKFCNFKVAKRKLKKKVFMFNLTANASQTNNGVAVTKYGVKKKLLPKIETKEKKISLI